MSIHRAEARFECDNCGAEERFKTEDQASEAGWRIDSHDGYLHCDNCVEQRYREIHANDLADAC